MDSVGVGVVGCGEIAQLRHIPSWKENKRATMLAITDVDEAKAKSVANQFHIPRYYTDFGEMLQKEDDLRIVDICIPTKYHKEYAVEACRHGKHVIVEKPMASTVHECEEMIRSARKNDVKLSVCHTMRFYPAIIKTKRTIVSGNLGEIRVLRFINPYLSLQEWTKTQGGVLWELGTHRVYLTMYLLGDIKGIDVRRLGQGGSQDNFEILLQTRNGLGMIHLLNAVGNEKIHILGSKGEIVIPPLAFNIALMVKEAENWTDLFLGELRNTLIMSQGLMKAGFDYFSKGIKVTPHYALFDQFLRSVFSDTEVPVPPEEGKKTIEVLLEIEQKLATSSEGFS